MSKEKLRFAKNCCWLIASVSMFFIIFGNTKNHPLSIIAFISIITGIICNILEDTK